VTRQELARRLGVSRQSVARRAAPRTPAGRRQLVGLAAVVAAATSAVTVTGSAAQSTEPATLSDAQLSAINTARVNRQLQVSRDSRRATLAQAQARQALAAKQAAARKAKLDAQRAQTMRRAKALAAAKKAAAAQKAAAKAAEESGGSGTSSDGAKLPVSGYHLTARFGQGGSRWAADHTGLDFAAPMGTRVGAVLPGKVVSASYAGAYGRQVIIRHGDGTETTYCHMSEFTVSVGDEVDAGDRVGSVGMTGNTTGPHLHFEVHPGGGSAIDPMPWLRKQGLRP
jgi:murein DD-endopeptidase MepM/ murein hydrolase activator NlpD